MEHDEFIEICRLLDEEQMETLTFILTQPKFALTPQLAFEPPEVT